MGEDISATNRTPMEKNENVKFSSGRLWSKGVSEIKKSKQKSLITNGCEKEEMKLKYVEEKYLLELTRLVCGNFGKSWMLCLFVLTFLPSANITPCTQLRIYHIYMLE